MPPPNIEGSTANAAPAFKIEGALGRQGSSLESETRMRVPVNLRTVPPRRWGPSQARSRSMRGLR